MPPKLTYYEEKDIFIDLDSGSMYSHEDLDFFMTMHTLHKKEQSITPSLSQLMETYPTARPCAMRGIREKIKILKNRINCLDEVRERKVKAIANVSMFDRPLYMKDIDEYIEKDLNEYEAQIKKYTFQLAYLKRLGEKKEVIKGGSYTEQDLEEARQVPITNFIKIRGDRKAKCVFHSERTASMHIYNDNHYYCFSCNESGDVIDLVKKLYNYNFRQAVELLIGKKL